MGALHVERLHGGRPLIEKIEAHPWENKVTFNPACVLLEDRAVRLLFLQALPVNREIRDRLAEEQALAVLVYRAQGRKTPEHDHTRSVLGLAVCTPDLRLLARLGKPLMVPEGEHEDLGIEDPRITRVGDRFVMIYTGYGSGKDRNRVRIMIATSPDLVHWTKHGLLHGTLNTIDNKNGMLFEPLPGKKLLMLHRPMEGPNAMRIHWAESTDVFGEWTDKGLFMDWRPNARFKDVWVGGGAPPMLLPDGRYLVLYHIGNRDAAGRREYDLGIALCDPALVDPIVRREEPLLRPTTQWETTGDRDLGVNNVVFVCGAYFWKGDLYFPYQGADTRILGGRIPGAELESFRA